MVTLVELPLVMPPAVAGLALLVAFGRFGLLGHTLSVLGIDLAFTQAAVVIAILFVASPFYLRGAIAAFEAVDADAARRRRHARRRARSGGCCGSRSRSPPAGWARPRRSRSRAGSASSARRSCSPAASRARTQTLPLAVYSLFDANLDQAIAIGVLLIIVSAAILLTSKLLVRSWTSSKSTSPSPGGRSIFAPR